MLTKASFNFLVLLLLKEESVVSGVPFQRESFVQQANT